MRQADKESRMFSVRFRKSNDDIIQTVEFENVKQLLDFYREDHSDKAWLDTPKWACSKSYKIYNVGHYVRVAIAETEDVGDCTDPHMSNVGVLSKKDLELLKVYCVRGSFDHDDKEWSLEHDFTFSIEVPDDYIHEEGFKLFSREKVTDKEILLAQQETERLAALNAVEAEGIASLLEKLSKEEIRFLKNNLKSSVLDKVDWYKFID